MNISLKFILLSTSLYVGLSTPSIVHAYPEDILENNSNKRVAQSDGNTAKRVKKSSEEATPADQAQRKTKQPPSKITQSGKRQKVEDSASLDLSTWKAVKNASLSSTQKDKKMGRNKLQEIVGNPNHPDHAKGLKFAEKIKVLKPNVALEKYRDVLTSETSSLEQKEVVLARLAMSKINHKFADEWLEDFIDRTSPTDPNRLRLGLYLIREQAYLSASTYRAQKYFSPGAYKVLREIMADPRHPLFLTACRKLFVGKVYRRPDLDYKTEFNELTDHALHALTEKASDPADPEHLEALLILIIGNDKDSFLSKEACMTELVLGHLKPLCKPEHSQYARIVEHLFFYGDEESQQEAFPLLVQNIWNRTNTKELKKASIYKMPATDYLSSQIRKAFKERDQGEQPLAHGPQHNTLFDQSFGNDLTLFNKKYKKINLLTKAADTKKTILKFLRAERQDASEIEQQKELYRKIKGSLASSNYAIASIYKIVKKLGAPEDLEDILRARIALHTDVLNRISKSSDNFSTPSGFNSLLTGEFLRDGVLRGKVQEIRGSAEDPLIGSTFTPYVQGTIKYDEEDDLELYEFSQTINDSKERQILETLAKYRALVLLHVEFQKENSKRKQVKLPKDLAISKEPYPITTLALLYSFFTGQPEEDKYKKLFRSLIDDDSTHLPRMANTPPHTLAEKALLRYALVDRDYAAEHYLARIENLFLEAGQEASPILKSDAAIIAQFLGSKNEAILDWCNAQSPFNAEGLIRNDFPTSYPYLWLRFGSEGVKSKFSKLLETYSKDCLFVSHQSLEEWLEIKATVGESVEELLCKVWSSYCESLQAGIRSKPLDSAPFQRLIEINNSGALDAFVPQIHVRMFELFKHQLLLRAQALSQPGQPVSPLSLNDRVWADGLNFPHPAVRQSVMQYVAQSIRLRDIVTQKFLDEAPQQLSKLEWEDAQVKDRLMGLLGKINADDPANPEYVELRSLLDYSEDTWAGCQYARDETTKAQLSPAEGFALLASKTQATLKKILNMPLSDQDKMLASPYDIPQATKPGFINALKHVIVEMERIDDPNARNVQLGIIVRALLFCDSGQSEAINTALINLVLKKQRRSTDFSHQLAGVMHELVSEAFDIAASKPMQHQNAHGTHFKGQLRDLLHLVIGLPKAIEGHTERYNSLPTPAYMMCLSNHFATQFTVKFIVDRLLKKAENVRQFNNELLGDTQIWLDGVAKQWEDYGIDEEDVSHMMLTPKLVIDYLIGRGWLQESARSAYDI